MSALKSLLLTVVIAAPSLVGCVRAYQPPTLAQPHAVLKVRRIYERKAGTTLGEALAVDGHPAQNDRVDVAQAATPRTTSVLLHPKPTEVALGSTFLHQEMRNVQESYTVQIPYSTYESYSCGYGTSYQTCSRMVTNYRSETRYRTVTKLVDVADGTCRQSMWLAPAKDGTYLLDLTYRDHGMCQVACYEQSQSKSGELTHRPCPAPSDSDKRANLSAR